MDLRCALAGGTQQQALKLEVEMTLGRACPPEYQGAQCAFKDSMTRVDLQFALRLAFRCVLHRCQSQEIHRCRLCLVRLSPPRHTDTWVF